jgi:hypothetical protein
LGASPDLYGSGSVIFVSEDVWMKHADGALDGLLSAFDPEIGDLTRRLCQFVVSAAPEARQKVNPGWGSLNFSHPGVGYFLGLFPGADRVDVAFEFGVLLPDPKDLLKGEGSQVRYLRLGAGEDLPEDELRHLIEAALDLPASRDERLEMVRSGARFRPTNEG